MRAQTDKSLLAAGLLITRLSRQRGLLALRPRGPPKLTARWRKEDPAHRCPPENNSPHSAHISVYTAAREPRFVDVVRPFWRITDALFIPD